MDGRDEHAQRAQSRICSLTQLHVCKRQCCYIVGMHYPGPQDSQSNIQDSLPNLSHVRSLVDCIAHSLCKSHLTHTECSHTSTLTIMFAYGDSLSPTHPLPFVSDLHSSRRRRGVSALVCLVWYVSVRSGEGGPGSPS